MVKITLSFYNQTQVEITFHESKPLFNEEGIDGNILNQEYTYYPTLEINRQDREYNKIEGVDLYVNNSLIGCFAKDNGIFSFTNQTNLSNNQDSMFRLNLYFGYILFTLVIRYKDTQKILYSNYYCIEYKSSEDNENITTLIEAISNLPNEWVFKNWSLDDSEFNKHSKIRGTWRRKSLKSISSYLKMLYDIIAFYKENYYYFKKNAFHKITQEKCIRAFSDVRKITQEDYKWLMQNSSMLEKNNSKIGFPYRNEYYAPSYLLNESHKKNINTYENQVLMGFLMQLTRECHNIKNKLNVELKKNSKILYKLDPSNERKFSNVIAIKAIQITLANKYISKLSEYEEQLLKLKNLYTLTFPITSMKFLSLPRCTKIFQEIKQYRLIYEYIVRWYEFGEFSLEQENILFNIRTLDTLFEYYCLLRLVGVFIENGWVLKKNDKFKYDVISDTDICNTYLLEKDDDIITIYYQPIIYDNKFENNISLFRTDFNGKNIQNFYTPDFLIRLEKNDDISYAILDSKYSKRYNINNYYLPEVLLKYMCKISDKYQENAIKMIWILQGRIDKEVSFSKLQNSELSKQYFKGISVGIQSVTVANDLNAFWREFECKMLKKN